MQTSPVPLLAENLPQQRYLEAIFRDLISGSRVKIRSGLGRDSALAGAESLILMYPDRHVAVVLEANSGDSEVIREFDRSSRHRLSLTDASGESWHLALAIPRLDAWALTDGQILHEFNRIRQDPASAKDERTREAIDRNNYLNLAARINEFTQARPFDLENLKRKSRQCRELCEFIERSFQPVTVPANVPATAAEWF
jgi:hypothetical protein